MKTGSHAASLSQKETFTIQLNSTAKIEMTETYREPSAEYIHKNKTTISSIKDSRKDT